MARILKWAGTTSDQWNVKTNWLLWDGSAYQALGVSDEIPGSDVAPSDDELVFTGSSTYYPTSRDATYGPNAIGKITVEASYAGTKVLPQAYSGDTLLGTIALFIDHKGGMDIPAQSAPITLAKLYAAPAWCEDFSIEAVELWAAISFTAPAGCAAVTFKVTGCSSGIVIDDSDPAAVGDVRKNTTYENGTKTGTLELPAVAKVIDDTSFGSGGTEFTGTYHATSADEVLVTAVFGPASGISGTVVLPTAAQTLDGVMFGAGAATEGTVVLPPTAKVEDGYMFGPGEALEGELVAGSVLKPVVE